jgi:hypothetical protein
MPAFAMGMPVENEDAIAFRIASCAPAYVERVPADQRRRLDAPVWEESENTPIRETVPGTSRSG